MNIEQMIKDRHQQMNAWRDKQNEKAREQAEAYEDAKMEHYDNLEEQREFENEAREEGLEE